MAMFGTAGLARAMHSTVIFNLITHKDDRSCLFIYLFFKVY